MNNKGTQPLETERLLLRRFTVDDAESMFNNWASDEENTRFMPWPAHTSVEVSRNVLEDWVKSYEYHDFYTWAIALKDGMPIGSISITVINEAAGCVELGYIIGKNWWHKGYTTEAAGAVIRYMLNDVGAGRIQAKHDTNNPNSGAVMRKCGMSYEGIMRRSFKNNTGICDCALYAMISE